VNPLLFGLETEYALSAVDARGAPVDRGHFVNVLIVHAQETLPHLPDETLRGMFLQHSGRFYLDAGAHVEASTPECDTPCDAVRYLMAGHEIIASLARAVDARHRTRTTVFRINVDYGSGNTFGSHESYGYRVLPSEMAAQILPHLVSRVVYTGSGGFNARSPGIEFMLSPRVAHIVHEKSPESTHDRGIIHTKDEPLRGGGFHRLHLICGDSTCSELSGWLRVGTTALIVALVDAGERPGADVQLLDPLSAFHLFARDTSCTATALSARQRPLTAIAIQRHYLDAAEAHLDDGMLPAWARDVCARWRTVLDQLEAGSDQLATTLDWAIKLPLYQARARTRGVHWATLPIWTGLVTSLRAAWSRSPRATERFDAEIALAPGGPIAAEITRLTPALKAAALDWRDLPQFLALRDELCEIDTRYGQLNDDGIFNRLDAAGVLTHHVDGVDRIAEAVANPPDVPRARRRSALVLELSGHKMRYSCDWSYVKDHNEHRIIDLTDPFAEPTWTPAAPDAFDPLSAARTRSWVRRNRASAAQTTRT
jgi:hypothetical protein